VTLVSVYVGAAWVRTLVYGPPEVVERCTLYLVAPELAVHVSATWALPAVAARPVGAVGALLPPPVDSGVVALQPSNKVANRSERLAAKHEVRGDILHSTVGRIELERGRRRAHACATYRLEGTQEQRFGKRYFPGIGRGTWASQFGLCQPPDF
jgi:hypothetical protein